MDAPFIRNQREYRMKERIEVKWQVMAILVIVILSFVGCQTPSQGSLTYTRGQAQRPLEVYYGTVLKVADVHEPGRGIRCRSGPISD